MALVPGFTSSFAERATGRFGSREVNDTPIPCDSPAHHVLRNVSPLVARLVLQRDDEMVLLIRPRCALDARVEVIIPTLSALLTETALEFLGNYRPFFSAVRRYERAYEFVFVGGPGALGWGWGGEGLG